jgi:hypothetical protein
MHVPDPPNVSCLEEPTESKYIKSRWFLQVGVADISWLKIQIDTEIFPLLKVLSSEMDQAESRLIG